VNEIVGYGLKGRELGHKKNKETDCIHQLGEPQGSESEGKEAYITHIPPLTLPSMCRRRCSLHDWTR
jgi:hypothetical protein